MSETLANILPTWADWMEFEIVGTSQEKDSLLDMVCECRNLILDIDHGKIPRWLSLLGNSGTGKSHLAKKVWNWYTRSRHFKGSVVEDRIVYPGTYVHWPELADDVLNNQNYERVSELADENFVVIDEIGLEKDRNGTLKDLLVRLLCRRTDKWTMITGNVGLAWVEKQLDVRVSSRMNRNGSVVVETNIRDITIRRK